MEAAEKVRIFLTENSDFLFFPTSIVNTNRILRFIPNENSSFKLFWELNFHAFSVLLFYEFFSSLVSWLGFF